MPRGPQGQRRPADVIGTAIKVAKIATGEIEDSTAVEGKEYARAGGLKGGPARAARLSPSKRKQIARKAAKVRWKS